MQVFSQQMFGRDNRIMDGAKLDLSNPKATVILPPYPGSSFGITTLTSPFMTVTPPPPPGSTVYDLGFNKQAPGMFLAGPVAGPQAVPTFRHINVADIAGIGGTFQPLNTQLTAISIGLWPGATSITTLGTIATGTWQATPIGAIYGGTGQNTYVLGDTLYASAANTLSRLAGNITASRNFLRQTGTGAVSAAPAWDTLLITDLITPNALGWLHNDGSGGLAWSTPALAAHNILSATHTDTVAASVVLGDVIFGNATPKWERLPGNTTLVRQFLRQVGSGVISAAPAWDTLQAGDIPALSYLSAVVSDAPLSGSGTSGSHLTFAVQNATKVLAGPAFGSPDAVPTFRALLATDIPALGYQAAYAILSTLGALANSTGVLNNDGMGVLSWASSAPAAPHNILSATHSDTLADTVILGDILAGNATPKWARIAGNTTLTRMFLRQTGTGAVSAVPAWDTLQAGDIPALSYIAAIVSDSPLTGSGTAGSHLTFSAQTATYVFAGPATGGAVAPAFRALVATDIPALGYQAAYANLTTIGALADGTGWLHDNGAGAFAYSTPSYSDVGAAPAFVSGTQNWVWATPNGIAGVPSLRALVAADIPALSYLAGVTSDSPLTGAGTSGSHLTFSAQIAATVFAGPATGVAVAPAFRALVATDIPALGYQAAFTILTTLGNLSTVTTGWLHNAAGVLAYSTPSYADVGAAPAFVSGTANFVWATPNGVAGVPSLRALVAADIPALAYIASITSDAPLSGAGTGGSHLVIAAVDSTHAGYIPASGTPAARNFLRAAMTTGVVAWDTLTSTDVGLASVTNDAQTKASIVPNTAPAAGQILVGNVGGTAYAPVTMGTDATLSSAGALTIANAAVTLAKMANMATASLIYRKTAGAGAPEVNTLATLKTDLAFAVGDLAAIANNTVLGNTSGGVAAPSALTATAGLTSYGIRDTSAAFDVQLVATSSTALSANRALTFNLVNAARTLKIQGNPTLDDWFDQSVKTTASPTFVGLKLSAKLTVTGANVRLSNAYFLSGNLAAGTEVTLIGRNVSNQVSIDPDGYQTVFGGNVGIGTTTPGSKLSIVGLPTSSAGLSAGDIWVDTTAGLNILKIK